MPLSAAHPAFGQRFMSTSHFPELEHVVSIFSLWREVTVSDASLHCLESITADSELFGVFIDFAVKLLGALGLNATSWLDLASRTCAYGQALAALRSDEKSTARAKLLVPTLTLSFSRFRSDLVVFGLARDCTRPTPAIGLDKFKLTAFEECLGLRNTVNVTTAWGVNLDGFVAPASVVAKSTSESLAGSPPPPKRPLGSIDRDLAKRSAPFTSSSIEEGGPQRAAQSAEGLGGSRPSILQRLGPEPVHIEDSAVTNRPGRDEFGCIPGIDPPLPQGKKSFCFKYLLGQCQYPICGFNHYTLVELATIACPSLSEGGFCKYGDNCVYRHTRP